MNSCLTRRAFLQTVLCALILPTSLRAGHRQTKFSIPVLLYHDISNDIRDDYTITPGLFAAQMEWLFQRGYKALSFRDTESAAIPERCVFITFDDGYASFVTYAFPILRSYGFRATVNIIGEYVNAFMEDRTVRPMLSWDEYRYLRESGLVSLGCHTDRLHTFRHRGAAGVTDDVLARDLKSFQERITRETGSPSEILAWPYGYYTDNSVAVARSAGFRYILTSDPGLYKSPADSAKIPRINISERTRLFDFRSTLGAQ